MQRPALVVQLAGHAGSGKTTIARGLAAEAGGVLLDLDTVKTALLDAGVPWEVASRASYSVIHALVDDMLAAPGAVLLVDTPSYWPEIHHSLTAAAGRAAARYVFLECEADERTRIDRIAARVPRRSQIHAHGLPPADAPSSLDRIHTRQICRPDGYRCLVVDTRHPVDMRALARMLLDGMER